MSKTYKVVDAGFYLQLLLNGIVIGVIYALVAMGLSLIFGVLEIVNFAHGEFYMLGAMLAYFLTMNMGLGYWATVVVVTAVAVCLGYVLYEALLASLRGRAASSGAFSSPSASPWCSRTARCFSSPPRPGWSRPPRATSTSWWATCASPSCGVFALALGLLAFGALYLILYRTRIGRAMRGVAQNRDAALMVGIDPRAVSRLAVAIGIGLSGLAGAALAPVYAVHPLMGFSFVFKAFAIIIIGGLGNVAGAAVAAVALGMLESVIGGFLPLVMVDALVFGSMIAMLLLRPQGLFGRGVRV